MGGNLKILVFTSNLGSRQAAKIREGFLGAKGVELVEICGFKRPIEPDPPFNCEVLGTVSPRKYFSRLMNYIRAFFYLRKRVSQFDITYTWGMDSGVVLILAIIMSFGKRVKFIYNIRDIHPLAEKNCRFGFFFRRLEKFVMENSDLVVSTSPHFINKYAKKMLGLKHVKYMVLENKTPPELHAIVDRKMLKTSTDGQTPVIGYMGMMSYARVLENIKKASELGVKFFLAGHNYCGESFQKDLKKYPNIFYAGPYKNPDDMERLFEHCDISWVVNNDFFKPESGDQWAMCNRFYEALFFKKPLIVQAEGPHSDYVLKHDIGVCIDTRDFDSAIEIMRGISIDDINRWKANMENLDAADFMLSGDEYSEVVGHTMSDQK